MTMLSLPSETHWVTALGPAADAAGRSAVWIDMKNAGRIYIVATITQGNAATIVLTPIQATTNTGTGSKALLDTCLIFLDDSEAASDGLVEQTAALSYTTDATLATKMVMFRIDPADNMDLVNGYSFIGFTTGASNAANITSVTYVQTDLRYDQRVNNEPTALI